MEELETIQRNYDNGIYDKNPKKASIENTILHELKKLYETNLKFRLIQCRYFKEDDNDINNLLSANFTKTSYLNIMENHISGLLNECRFKLLGELKDIEFTLKRKEWDKKRIQYGDVNQRKIEQSVLTRLNTMPEDIVRVVGEFLFTPKIRNVLIKDKYVPDLFVFNKIRMPKLKKMARAISFEIQSIGQKIVRNKSIMNSIPTGHDDRFNIFYISTCRKEVRETVKKSNKIVEITNFVSRCENAVQIVEKLGYPNTVKICHEILNKIYHLMILASKPEFNKRRICNIAL